MEQYTGYIPPFTVSADAINMIAEISAQTERYAIRLEQADGLRLRKANRIHTIHSSLAIEGNTLSENEVRDIIEGKNVVAPVRQIQEVKNAIATYDLYKELDPFKVDDLLRAHATMMQALTADAGRFRRQGVGVFSENGVVHVAPPADRVPTLVNELFGWLRTAGDHLLIRSCVFHYELDFNDGNLTPVEQRFVMTFGAKFGAKFGVKFGVNDMKILLLLNSNPVLTASQLSEMVGLSKRGVEKQIKKLRELNILSRAGSAKKGLWVINKDK